jgi:hypothetical protein
VARPSTLRGPLGELLNHFDAVLMAESLGHFSKVLANGSGGKAA